MNHQTWIDLIPFYVAGTLSRDEMKQLERHLSECQSCRRHLEEWRAVQNVVLSYASGLGRELPPLSASIRESVQSGYDVSPSRITRLTSLSERLTLNRRAQRQSLTLVASLTTLFLVVTVLAVTYLGSPGSDPDTASVGVVLSDQATDIPQTAIAQQRTPDMGILPTTERQQPTNTPIWTPLPPNPTAKVQSVLPQGGGIEALPMQPTNVPDIATNSCLFLPNAGSPVEYFNAPADINPPQGVIYSQEEVVVIKVDVDGWHEIQVPGVGLAWVRSTEGELSSDCGEGIDNASDLSANDLCRINSVSGTAITLYADRDETSTSVAEIIPPENAFARALTDDGWYGVEYVTPGGIQTGWVRRDRVTLSTDCTGLAFLINTPTPTPTERAASEIVLMFSVSPQNAEPGEMVTLSWETAFAEQVWLEYYDPDVTDPSNVPGYLPDEVLSGLEPSGQLQVVIPEDYENAITFRLIVDAQGRTTGVIRSVTVRLQTE